jgi:methionyl-tRNA synthetase
MASRPFYVTTPIYYVNSVPHVGTAYSTLAADVFARYARVRGRPARFLTGLDEHGLKIARLAAKEGVDPQTFVDRAEPPFRRAWEVLGCAYDDFIRTTEPRHERHVQELWRRVRDAGDIYLGAYEDWYCVDCESYYKEKDLLPGHQCPTHRRSVEKIREASYFFRLSRYTERLLAFYESRPDFVRPEGRYNEVKAFVREGLEDLSISRTSFRWGIPVPDDPEHVMYVWFDALTNYVSALGGPPIPGADDTLFRRFWPRPGDPSSAEAVNLVGKDILRFHAVYWPAFLMSAGLAPPTRIQVHGFLTVNGDKIGKSSGNAIAPEPLAEAFGADVLRYHLMRDIGFGHDGDFSHASLLARYHGELGNGLGNLLHRMVASIVHKSLDGRVPRVNDADLTAADREVVAAAARAADQCATHMDQAQPNRALEAVWELVSVTNRYVDRQAPWHLAKTGASDRLRVVAYVVLEALRWCSVMLWPVMPRKCDALRAQLGLPPLLPTEGVDLWPCAWGGLAAGTVTRPGPPLFPRLDEAQQRALLERLGVAPPGDPPRDPEVPKEARTRHGTAGTTSASGGAVAASPSPSVEKRKSMEARNIADGAPTGALATLDDLAKIDLRLGLVKAAERVPKSDKLMRLEVDLGEPEVRQILAGIGKVYAPDDLVGRRIVVVANLAPRKLMGFESRGMVLAAGGVLPGAEDASGGGIETLSVLTVDKDLPPGAVVK